MIFQFSRSIIRGGGNRKYTASCKLFNNDRLHSTDIAYKPNESGWGYTKKFVANYDEIFKSKKSPTLTEPTTKKKDEKTKKTNKKK